MHKVFKTSAYLLCLTFFSGCSAKLTQKNDFNAYLPPSYSEFEVAERVRPIEQIITNHEESWDVSDVDISYVDPNKKLISFTFDDGPSKTMENILAVFADYNEQNPDCIATASFFLNGGYITEEALRYKNNEPLKYAVTSK